MTAPALLAPGVWRLTTPLPFRPREVHAYLLEVEGNGFVLVDGGVDTEEAWTALDAGVREIAGGWEQVRVQLVTHMHMDHIGLARRVRATSGAPLLMHRLDAERYAHAEAHPEEEADYRDRLLRENGAPEALITAINEGHRQAAAPIPSAATVELLEGDRGALPGIPGWSFVWTPGHTAGHISLLRESDRLLVAGDAVLPHITPTIGVNRQRLNPVGDYLDALERLKQLEPTAILPGHGEPIAEPLERLWELQEATLQESERVAACLSAVAATAWAITGRRHSGRDLPPAVQMLALRETLAHLQHLTGAGRARQVVLGAGVVGFSSL